LFGIYYSLALFHPVPIALHALLDMLLLFLTPPSLFTRLLYSLLCWYLLFLLDIRPTVILFHQSFLSTCLVCQLCSIHVYYAIISYCIDACFTLWKPFTRSLKMLGSFDNNKRIWRNWYAAIVVRASLQANKLQYKHTYFLISLRRFTASTRLEDSNQQTNQDHRRMLHQCLGALPQCEAMHCILQHARYELEHQSWFLRHQVPQKGQL